MLAKRVGELPVGGTWIFEPKWDGFRALVFRDGDEILIQSRDEKSLNRYFPELLGKVAVLSRAAGALTVGVAGALRARWRNRRSQEWGSRLRGATASHSSGHVAGDAAVQGNPGINRVLRPALRRRSGSPWRTVPKPAQGAGIATLTPGTTDPPDTGNPRIERRVGLVPAL